MSQVQYAHVQPQAVFSPLMLSDQLISLAQAADVAGFAGTADQLVTLAFSVLDAGPGRPTARDRTGSSPVFV